MAKFFACSVIVFSFLLAVLFGNGRDRFLKLSPAIRVAKTPKDFKSDVGVVNGVRYCGGPTKILDWRYESCSGKGTCQAIANGINQRVELTFVPSERIPGGIGLRINMTVVDVLSPNRIYDTPIPDSAVRGGLRYTIFSAGSPGKDLQGNTITFQYTIFRQDDNKMEACAEAEFKIV